LFDFKETTKFTPVENQETTPPVLRKDKSEKKPPRNGATFGLGSTPQDASQKSYISVGAHVGVSKNRAGPPNWMVKIMENPIKMEDFWGYHYFWKHPC